jgi:putative oxidoreductase
MVNLWFGGQFDRFYGALRIVGGLLFACHGAQKLFGVLGGDGVTLVSRVGFAGVVELFGGGLVAFGIFTPYVAFIMSGQMAFAYFLSHAPRGFWPIMNGGELAVLYCFLFLYIAAKGAGPFSLDYVIWGAKDQVSGPASTRKIS